MPDLYQGRVFKNLEEGAAHAQGIGSRHPCRARPGRRGRAARRAGVRRFSLGVLPAQYLAQTRTGAKGALLFHSCVPASEFGGDWPRQVPVQIHGMEADEYFVDEGDLDAAPRRTGPDAAELFLYPGKQHLFADNSLPSYDEHAATLLTRRALALLDGIE